MIGVVIMTHFSRQHLAIMLPKLQRCTLVSRILVVNSSSHDGTVEEALMLAHLFERAARMQLVAMAAGNIQPIDESLAKEAHDWTSTPKRHQAFFAYYARRTLRKQNDCLQ